MPAARSALTVLPGADRSVLERTLHPLSHPLSDPIITPRTKYFCTNG